jgi:hypothetical protein
MSDYYSFVYSFVYSLDYSVYNSDPPYQWLTFRVLLSRIWASELRQPKFNAVDTTGTARKVREYRLLLWEIL